MHVSDDDMRKIALMGALGAIGGVVRLCNEPGNHNAKEYAAGVMTSAFAGALAYMILHDAIEDTMYLCAAASSCGYMGQVGIVIAIQWLQRVTGVDFHMYKRRRGDR